MKNNGNKKKAGQMNFKRKSIPMKIANKAMLSTCKIKIKEKNNKYLKHGTGFFMKVSNSLGCLITNYHVIGNDKVYEYIELETCNNIKMKLDLSNRYMKFFNKPTDITIIEIKNTDIIYKDIEFLRYDSNYINGYDIYKNIDVFTIEYPFGENASSASGLILNIYDFQFDHNIPTEEGSSGCPIILLNSNINYLDVLLYY